MNPLGAIAYIAERKIEEAMAEGQFDNLPGIGRPLELEDLSHLPPDMRMAYTILKNSGYIDKSPEPGQTLSMAELLSEAKEERAAYGKMQRLKVMMAWVQRAREDQGVSQSSSDSAASDETYLEKLVARV